VPIVLKSGSLKLLELLGPVQAFNGIALPLLVLSRGHAVAQLVEALHYKPEGCGFDFRWCNWNFFYIILSNCLLKRVTEEKIKGGIKVTGRQGRKRRKLLDDLKERRRYSHLKEEALDRTMWRAPFGRGFGPVVRQTTK
jgi:hypothetical protein